MDADNISEIQFRPDPDNPILAILPKGLAAKAQTLIPVEMMVGVHGAWIRYVDSVSKEWGLEFVPFGSDKPIYFDMQTRF